MSTTDSARREQVTTSDPDRAVRVLEAHLGRRLATWQRYWMRALLTPTEEDDAEP